MQVCVYTHIRALRERYRCALLLQVRYIYVEGIENGPGPSVLAPMRSLLPSLSCASSSRPLAVLVPPACPRTPRSQAMTLSERALSPPIRRADLRPPFLSLSLSRMIIIPETPREVSTREEEEEEASRERAHLRYRSHFHIHETFQTRARELGLFRGSPNSLPFSLSLLSPCVRERANERAFYGAHFLFAINFLSMYVRAGRYGPFCGKCNFRLLRAPPPPPCVCPPGRHFSLLIHLSESHPLRAAAAA